MKMVAYNLVDGTPELGQKSLYSWYNTSSAFPYNGTDVEGDKSLGINDFFLQQIVANNVAVAALTLYGWEYISTVYDEIHLYCTHKLCSRHVILFILVRYGTLPSLILPAYSVWHDFSQNASGCLQHQQLAICAVQFIVSIVFAWRTIAIWGHGRKITAFFSVIVCLQFGASIGLLWFSEEKLLPNGGCMPVTPLNGFNPLPIFYAIAFAYDFLTIGLSTFKLWQFSSLGRGQEPSTSEHWTKVASSPKLFARMVRRQWIGMSSSPLVQRLTQAGLIYLVVATAFNACSFALEVRKDIHSKALITLYAPLMCILCQRIILLDVKAIYGGLSSSGDGSHEKDLVDRVMSERRFSWEGSDIVPIHSRRQRELSEKMAGVEHEQKRHVALDMNTNSEQSGIVGFMDMLSESSGYENSSKTGEQRKNSLDASDPPSSQDSGINITSDKNIALAIQMAGLDQQAP